MKCARERIGLSSASKNRRNEESGEVMMIGLTRCSPEVDTNWAGSSKGTDPGARGTPPIDGNGVVGIVCRLAFCSATCRAMDGKALTAATQAATARKVVFIVRVWREKKEKEWGKAFFPTRTTDDFI